MENISRNKANELIKGKKVTVEGKAVTKPSFLVKKDDKIEIQKDELYVSRSAMKLKNYLLEHPTEIKNRTCLDVGSSTGGFTQVLLEHEPQSVTCVDTGKKQLHQDIKNNDKVIVYEECDIRDYKEDKRYDLIVSDVSFISLAKIIEKLDRLAKKQLILLFKPQFEVGMQAKRNKKGVVTDIEAIEEAMVFFEKETTTLGWKLIRKEKSSILGKEGNVEFIYEFYR